MGSIYWAVVSFLVIILVSLHSDLDNYGVKYDVT